MNKRLKKTIKRIKKFFTNIKISPKLIKFIRNKKIFIIFGAIVVLFLIFVFVVLYKLNTPLGKNIDETIFTVEEGRGLEQIADELRENNLIRNKWIFYYYVWLQDKEGDLIAGKYNLSESMSIKQIADKILNGDVFENWIKATILEGWTNELIEKRLVDLEILNPDNYDFYEISTEEYDFLKDKPEGMSLQGYLFPDTYYFDKDSSSELVVKKMLDNFNIKITKELREEIEKQGKTLYEILTMASIIEKEVYYYEDMRIVSGIFWKRINDNYPLQSCATIAYILGVDKARYTIRDTQVNSPYNTYLNKGLPPGPINNPGLLAIKAAIYPIQTDYYFFLSAPSGETIFSKTAQEHNLNKAKYLD